MPRVVLCACLLVGVVHSLKVKVEKGDEKLALNTNTEAAPGGPPNMGLSQRGAWQGLKCKTYVARVNPPWHSKCTRQQKGTMWEQLEYNGENACWGKETCTQQECCQPRVGTVRVNPYEVEDAQGHRILQGLSAQGQSANGGTCGCLHAIYEPYGGCSATLFNKEKFESDGRLRCRVYPGACAAEGFDEQCFFDKKNNNMNNEDRWGTSDGCWSTEPCKDWNDAKTHNYARDLHLWPKTRFMFEGASGLARPPTTFCETSDDCIQGATYVCAAVPEAHWFRQGGGERATMYFGKTDLYNAGRPNLGGEKTIYDTAFYRYHLGEGSAKINGFDFYHGQESLKIEAAGGYHRYALGFCAGGRPAKYGSNVEAMYTHSKTTTCSELLADPRVNFGNDWGGRGNGPHGVVKGPGLCPGQQGYAEALAQNPEMECGDPGSGPPKCVCIPGTQCMINRHVGGAGGPGGFCVSNIDCAGTTNICQKQVPGYMAAPGKKSCMINSKGQKKYECHATDYLLDSCADPALNRDSEESLEKGNNEHEGRKTFELGTAKCDLDIAEEGFSNGSPEYLAGIGGILGSSPFTGDRSAAESGCKCVSHVLCSLEDIKAWVQKEFAMNCEAEEKDEDGNVIQKQQNNGGGGMVGGFNADVNADFCQELEVLAGQLESFIKMLPEKLGDIQINDFKPLKQIPVIKDTPVDKEVARQSIQTLSAALVRAAAPTGTKGQRAIVDGINAVLSYGVSVRFFQKDE